MKFTRRKLKIVGKIEISVSIFDKKLKKGKILLFSGIISKYNMKMNTFSCFFISITFFFFILPNSYLANNILSIFFIRKWRTYLQNFFRISMIVILFNYVL